MSCFRRHFPPARSSRTPRRIVWFAAAIIAAGPLSTASVRAETWTDLRGTRSIEAEMVGLWNDHVILDMNGRRVSVPMLALRSDSRIQAQKLWEKIKQDRQQRIDEFQGQASAADAPAPDPIPVPPAPPNYQPPVSGVSCQAFLQHLDSQLAAGHLLVIYDSLPPGFRNDISGLVQLAATKVNPNAWQAAVRTVGQVGDLLVTHQNWFFSYPRIESLDQPPGFRQRLLLIAGIMQQGFDPQQFDLSRIQSAEFRQWLADVDRAIAPYVAALIEQADARRQFSVQSETADSAVVKMTHAGVDKDVNFVNIEGYWVPKQMADSWANSIAAIRAEIEQAPAGGYLAEPLAALASLSAIVGPLASASDEREFHARTETMIQGSQDMIAAVASNWGIPLASNDPRNRRSGYGYEGEDMYEEDMYAEDMYEEGMDEDLYGEEEMYEEEMEEEFIEMAE